MRFQFATFVHCFLMLNLVESREVQRQRKMKNSQLLRITARSHDPSIVENQIQTIFKEMFPIAIYNPTRSCIDGSSITYLYKDCEYIYNEYPISECRLNVDSQFLAVIKPKEQVHLQIHNDLAPNPILKEVEESLINVIDNSPDFNINFFSFNDLNYNMECPIDYYEIAQVKLKELLLKVTLEKEVQIASACGFSTLSSDDNDEGCLKSYEYLEIPINGTFLCAKGPSSTCKRSTAITLNAHLRNKMDTI